MAKLKVVTMLSLATLFTPVFAQGTNPARPGTINYVEGQAAINGAVISPQSVGVAAVNAGQILATGNGKAEMLLTPGVFLRVGNNSVVKMVSPDLTHTEVSLERGRAEIEVDQLFKQNDLQVDVPNSGGGAQVALIDRGLYEFDAKAGELKVFDGKAAVSESESAKKWIDVKGGHEIALNGSAMKSNGFNKDTSEDDLYHWSALRSQYLGEANASMGAEYAGGGLYPGWAWDAGYGYTWFPYDGLAYSPFGFGFYSPAFFYGGGFGYYGGFRGGFYRGGYGGGFHGGFGGGGGFHGGGGGRR